VGRVLVALDAGSEVVGEAKELGCECLVTHHPLLFRPIQTLRTDSWPGSVIALAVVSGINIIAAHTNVDAARGGTNGQLKDLLGLEGVSPIEVDARLSDESQYIGIGLVGELPRELNMGELARQLSDSLDGAGIKMVGDPGKTVRRAAICTGSGASLIGDVVSAGADVYITGDIKYHDAKLAEECGLAILDVGHFASEKLVLEPIAALLASKALEEGGKLESVVSRSEKDPFRTIR